MADDKSVPGMKINKERLIVALSSNASGAQHISSPFVIHKLKYIFKCVNMESLTNSDQLVYEEDITIFFLPNNVTNLKQTMDKEVIASFKRWYR